ncbi:hypothetical protein A6R68_09677, partial [Neotoma lepida]
IPNFLPMKLEMVLNISEITIFLLITGLGTVANISVFVNHICTFVGSGKKSIHLILMHLAFTNIIMLFCKSMPTTIAALGLRHFLGDGFPSSGNILKMIWRDLIQRIIFINFLGDIGYKTIIYLEKVACGLSICTTCFLSVVQAVTISPRTTLCRQLKPQAAWQVLPFLLLFWVFNSLISSNLLHCNCPKFANCKQNKRIGRP